MILQELVSASLGCFHFGANHAALLLALSAVDATAKKRYADEKSVGRRFKDFLRDEMIRLSRVQNFWVAVDMPVDKSSLPRTADGIPDIPRVGDDFYDKRGNPRMVLMQGVLYHAFRCALSHEADLPDVELLPAEPEGSITVRVDTKVRISANIIGNLLAVVMNCPENQVIFNPSG